MKQYIIMLKPASSLCNMRCRYCFYADVSSMREIRSFGLMSKETVSAILDHVFVSLTDEDMVSFVFQGGEPTLAGLDFFKSFVEEADKKRNGIQVTYALQTNGMLIDGEWCGFLKENRFLVGLSLDMYRELHDCNRVDNEGSGTYRAVNSARQLLDHFGVEYNILSVLTNAAARHPQQIWKYIKSQDLRYVQFIPCLDGLEAEEKSDCSLSPERFASFYKTLFSFWLKDLKAGRYTSIKLFDDIVHLLSDGRQTACGITGRCSPQLVVEADGSTYPCDFYMLDRYKTGSFSGQTLEGITASETGKQFAQEERRLPEKCSGCRYSKICGGGCRRMFRNVCISDGSSYCGYEDFLDYALADLLHIARQLKGSR